MYISDDGIKLHIELEMPEKAPDKVPLVIVNHGFTGHMEEDHIVAAARACREKGYATLRVEMYGHGQSGGDFKDHTLFKWISNLIAVIDYARSLDFVTDIYLCGHSQGGLNVMLVGGMKHEHIKIIYLQTINGLLKSVQCFIIAMSVWCELCLYKQVFSLNDLLINSLFYSYSNTIFTAIYLCCVNQMMPCLYSRENDLRNISIQVSCTKANRANVHLFV